MVYIIQFKDGPSSEYYLTNEYSGEEYTLYLLDFPATGTIVFLNSKKTAAIWDKEKIFIVFVALDLIQLISFFSQQNIKCLMTGLINEEEAAKFQRYVLGKKAAIIQ